MANSSPHGSKASRFIANVLRHAPGLAGLTPDGAGWVRVRDLLRGMKANGHDLSLEELKVLVETNDKKRFAFSHNGQLIRANQGHSFPVDLGLERREPPLYLFHGTTSATLPAIKASGLLPMTRIHVHLSADIKTAMRVGGRHGKPVVLPVLARDLHDDNHPFYLSANDVWLAGHVPAHRIKFGQMIHPSSGPMHQPPSPSLARQVEPMVERLMHPQPDDLIFPVSEPGFVPLVFRDAAALMSLMTSPSRTSADDYDVVFGCRSLVERLSSRKPIGPILANGEPEFGYRDYSTTPLFQKAQALIQALFASMSRPAPSSESAPS